MARKSAKLFSNTEVHARMVTSLPSFSLSLSLSLSLYLSLSLSPNVPHAQYRKRFRASYNMCLSLSLSLSLYKRFIFNSLYARFETSVAILTFGCRWPRRRPRFHSKEKNLTFLSRNLSTVAPHLLKPFLNLQTSQFIKVLHVIRLREFWNDGKWFSHASCFFRVFLLRGRKTTKIDCKSLNFVSMYWPRS